LVTELAEKKFAQTSPALRDNILGFYANATAPAKPMKGGTKWEKVSTALDQLRSSQPSSASTASPAD